jgi:hypothetical protein
MTTVVEGPGPQLGYGMQNPLRQIIPCAVQLMHCTPFFPHA